MGLLMGACSKAPAPFQADPKTGMVPQVLIIESRVNANESWKFPRAKSIASMRDVRVESFVFSGPQDLDAMRLVLSRSWDLVFFSSPSAFAAFDTAKYPRAPQTIFVEFNPPNKSSTDNRHRRVYFNDAEIERLTKSLCGEKRLSRLCPLDLPLLFGESMALKVAVDWVGLFKAILKSRSHDYVQQEYFVSLASEFLSIAINESFVFQEGEEALLKESLARAQLDGLRSK